MDTIDSPASLTAYSGVAHSIIPRTIAFMASPNARGCPWRTMNPGQPVSQHSSRLCYETLDDSPSLYMFASWRAVMAWSPLIEEAGLRSRPLGGLVFLLVLFRFSFVLWSKLSLFLLLSSAFIFFSLITHACFSLLENDL